MEYLTASEMAKRWNVTSRMVAIYCKQGRVPHAEKKGDQWLIPANAVKPSDHRSRHNHLYPEKNPAVSGNHINQQDIENQSKTFRTGEMYKNVGVTRETLRYYEELGLIAPKRQGDGEYRAFSMYDVARLLAIDFYKKRGFSPGELRDTIQGADLSDLVQQLDKKQDNLNCEIDALRRISHRLEETRTFCAGLPKTLGQYTVREMPRYQVVSTFDAATDFASYREKVLGYIESDADPFSSMARVVSFNESGYIGSSMCVVRQDNGGGAGELTCLIDGRSLYTVISVHNDDNSVMESAFTSTMKWCQQHGESVRGVVYIFTKLLLMREKQERNYYEVWVPLKNK